MSFLSSVGSLFGWFQGQSEPPGEFTPCFDDVRKARAILKTLNLPTELVLQILGYAQYWPQHVFVTSPDEAKVAQATSFVNSHACLCLDAAIFNNPTADTIRRAGETPKIQSLAFEIVSRDQGWTSENTTNTYSTSSWLEVSIMRTNNLENMRLPSPSTRRSGSRLVNPRLENPSDFHQSVADRGWFLVKRPESAEQGPQGGEGDFAWYLQGNRVAADKDQYNVIWTQDESEGNEGAGSGEGFLNELKDGDRMLVFARAKWGGWRCIVERVKVTVRYGF